MSLLSLFSLSAGAAAILLLVMVTAMATAVEAMPAEALTLVSDAAAMLTAAQSAANGRPDGDDGSAAIAMQ